MPNLYRHLITRTPGPTGTELRAAGDHAVTVADLDGYRYVAIDGEPEPQPEGLTLEPVELLADPALREQIKAASPQCRLIARQVVGRIRAQYSPDDEMYFARISIGALFAALQGVVDGMAAQGADVTELQALLGAAPAYVPAPEELAALMQYPQTPEDARQWGREQRARLGL